MNDLIQRLMHKFWCKYEFVMIRSKFGSYLASKVKLIVLRVFKSDRIGLNWVIED